MGREYKRQHIITGRCVDCPQKAVANKKGCKKHLSENREHCRLNMRKLRIIRKEKGLSKAYNLPRMPGDVIFKETNK